jgi:hypothetical protein
MSAITGIHPYADKFPMLPESELAELAESIRANGLRSPVVLTPDGLILDGRNRYAACQQVEVEPETVIYEGADLAEYVIDCNSTRRNMSTGARAMSTAMVLASDGRRENGRWKRGSVKVGSNESVITADWQQRLKEAGIVLDFLDALAVPVRDGDLALAAAHRKACEARDSERNRLAEAERLAAEEADARTFIEDTAPDLAAQVGDDSPFRTYVEARDVWNRRNREEAARLKAEKDAENRRKSEDESALVDLYSGIARGLQILGGYGGYNDIPTLMAEYSPARLNPPQYAREYEPENLRRVIRFTNTLIELQGNNND